MLTTWTLLKALGSYVFAVDVRHNEERDNRSGLNTWYYLDKLCFASAKCCCQRLAVSPGDCWPSSAVSQVQVFHTYFFFSINYDSFCFKALICILPQKDIQYLNKVLKYVPSARGLLSPGVIHCVGTNLHIYTVNIQLCPMNDSLVTLSCLLSWGEE